MVGLRPGYPPTQLQTLCHLFERAGYPTISASARDNRIARLSDIVKTIVLRRREIDVLIIDVFSGTSFIVADLASLLGRVLRKPVLLILRGGALPQFSSRHPRWVRRVFGRADAIVAPSEFLARVAVQLGFCPQVIPNVIDLSKYPYRHRERVNPRLFWMRSFHTMYNPVMAVRVMERLNREIPEVSLVMAGQDKGLQSVLINLAQEAGLGSSVRFPGILDMAGKTREGSAADIFLITNRIDNMPVTALEACAMGLPVVATAVGGIPDLLKNEETGLLVPDDSDEAMACAIRRLINERGLAARLSANGRRLAERSSWKQVQPLWDEILSGLISTRTSAMDFGGARK
jgi:glycosyltransferase involved in cell wall biosynthesis